MSAVQIVWCVSLMTWENVNCESFMCAATHFAKSYLVSDAICWQMEELWAKISWKAEAIESAVQVPVWAPANARFQVVTSANKPSWVLYHLHLLAFISAQPVQKFWKNGNVQLYTRTQQSLLLALNFTDFTKYLSSNDLQPRDKSVWRDVQSLKVNRWWQGKRNCKTIYMQGMRTMQSWQTIQEKEKNKAALIENRHIIDKAKLSYTLRKPVWHKTSAYTNRT